jgi:tetratricopeptide (TPR) repeat protein
MSDRAEPAWDLFVSYAEADRAWVEGYLLPGLREKGVRCLTPAGFRLGAFWTDAFERAVAESHRVLLVLSAAYRADLNQQFLDQLARYYELENETESVIPLLLDGVLPPPGIRAKVCLRATTDEERTEAVERLARECRAGPPPAVPEPRCPYPGMAPFDRGNAEWFHGRRREVEELLQELRHRRCLFLIGRSGSGKSSLVLAGLLPRLEEGRTVRVMRPGPTPAATLAVLTGGQPGPCLLVVDQFEEVYTRATAEEAKQFQEALGAWLEALEHVLLVTVRADFYPDLQASPAIFPLFQANHRDVLPLGKEALREAIVGPATRAGVFAEPALVERLLADAAGEPCVLPHLQEAMQLLWARRRRRYLPLEAYQELGRDGRTGLQQAMAVVADAAVDDLTPEQQALARRTLLRLVQFGEGREDTRRSQPLSALESAGDPPGALDRVLARLISRRLVVPDTVRVGATDTQVLDLAHEALITGWPRLQGWVRESREAEQTRRRLEGNAAEWVRLGRGAGGLLDDVELHEAEGWLSQHGGEMGASAELRALVGASRGAIQESERQKEAVRQRELQQAHALAAEQRRRVRTLRRSLLAAVMLLVVLAGTAWYAWRQSEAAAVALRDDREHTAQAHADAAEEALKWGGWETALAESDAAREGRYPGEVRLRLVRLKAFAALNNLQEANRELRDLAGRADLGEYGGSVRLWEGDLLLSRSARSADEARRLVREGLDKHIKDKAEEEYARALLADNWDEAVGHLQKALDPAQGGDPVHHRANAMLAALYFCSGRLEQARERVTFAEFFFPNDPTFTILQAMIAAMTGREEEASRRLEKLRNQLRPQQWVTAQQLVTLTTAVHRLDLSIARHNFSTGVLEDLLLRLLKGALDLASRIREDPGMSEDVAVLPLPPFLFKALSPLGADLLKLASPAEMAAMVFRQEDVVGKLLDTASRAADVVPDGQLLAFRGLRLASTNRWEEAESFFLRALDPKTHSLFVSARLYALYGAASCEWVLGHRVPPDPERQDRAKKHLRELVRELARIDALSADWGPELSDLALTMKEYDLVRWVILEWEKRATNDLDAQYRRLQLECETGNYSRAVAVADQILKREPRDKKVLEQVRDRQAFALENLRRQLEAHKPSGPDRR